MSHLARARAWVATTRNQVAVLGRGAALGERLYSLLRRSPSFGAEIDERALRAAPDHHAATDRTGDEDGVRQARTDELDRRVGKLMCRVEQLGEELATARVAMTRALWAVHQPVERPVDISVVLPTGHEHRQGWLRDAIDSVVQQSHGHWELVVVDDAPEPFADAIVEEFHDERIRVVRSDRRNNGGARTVGVAASVGEVVAYLDDDNRFFPWWLRAVAATFAADDALQGIYGIRMIDPVVLGTVDAGWLSTAFDEVAFYEQNYFDTNCIAHRRTLAVSWSESEACSDFEMVIDSLPLAWRHVHVPACTYGGRAKDRIWGAGGAGNEAAVADVQRSLRRIRPLRVLAHNPLFPLSSETYIADELTSLIGVGLDVAQSRQLVTTYPPERAIDAPLYESLEAGIAAHQPDVVLLHWASNALEHRGQVVAAGLPYAVRSHSFDRDVLAQVVADPACVAVFGFGHEGVEHPKFRVLPALIHGEHPLGSPVRRPGIVTASATLSKRGFDTMLIPAVGRLGRDVTCSIILGGTDGFDEVVDRVRRSAAAVRGVEVFTEVPYEDVQHHLRDSAVAVYSLLAGIPVGQPRLVIEAALAGCDLVLPDRPELRRMVDDQAHFYLEGDRDSLTDALADALDHPVPWAERVTLADRVRSRHDVSVHAERFGAELSRAVGAWRRRNRDDVDGRLSRWWSTI